LVNLEQPESLLISGLFCPNSIWAKQSWLSQVADYILDFGPIIATVLVATLVSLKATQGSITTSAMLQMILVALALLAITQLVDFGYPRVTGRQCFRAGISAFAI